MKIKSLILLFIISLLVIGGCSSPQSIELLDINSIIKDQLESKELQVSELLINQKVMSFLGIFIGSIFIGIIIIFLGLKKVGISLVISAMVCISLILGLSLYTKYVALIGMLSILVGIYFLGKEIMNKNRFEKEIINSVEVVKNHASETDKIKFKEKLDKIQSMTTKKKVKSIKKNI